MSPERKMTSPHNTQESSATIFALDIGTRQCVGILAIREGDSLRIVDVEIREHSSRTMLDGQIHNVFEVTKIVQDIKQALEARQHCVLSQVGVALAGRALRTVRAGIRKEISLYEEISVDAVRNMELEAVSNILRDAASEFGTGDFYCVGYSVLTYSLDGTTIGDLAGHYGKQMSVDVIATFLPRVVLDSMLSVLRKAGLEATNLTLEPIAAINVIIPPDIRRLNLSLIDIGAGTSDIALTREGTVVGYGMVPEAGDEITETLCEQYILDFNTAEIIKRQLNVNPTVHFRDILGRQHEVATALIKEQLRDRVRQFAESLSRHVVELNLQVPHAIVLVGGGSLTPLLEEELSRAFPLAASKIGIRLPNMVEGIIDTTGKLQGPEMVTPLGILVMTARSQGLRFVEVYVNGRRLQVLDMQQSLDVVSALVAAGIDSRRLYGKIGQALCVDVNNELKVIRGQMGTPAQITINDQPAQLKDTVRHADRIGFVDAVDGSDGAGRVKDVISSVKVRVTANGQPVELSPLAYMNGDVIDLETELADRASIVYQSRVTAQAVLEALGVNSGALAQREVIIRVNHEPRVLTQANFRLSVNGKAASLDTEVSDGSVVEFVDGQPAYYRVRDVVELPAAAPNILIMVNGAPLELPGNPGRVYMNGQIVGPDEFVIDRAEIVTLAPEKVPPTVAQVLPTLSLDVEAQKGKRCQISVNGVPGGFTTPLSAGAEVKISFSERL